MYTDNEYIVEIYQHPGIEEQDKNNYKSVFATRDISFGELLLIEHSYSGSNTDSQLIVANNNILFDLYHPRIKKFSECNETERLQQSVEKVSHNCFGLNNNKILTFGITKINHSCDPNCSVFIQERYRHSNTEIIFMELFAVRNIKKGSELKISYGPETGHNRDFECNCGKNVEERKKLFDTVSGISRKLSEINRELIREKIYSHIESIPGKKILLNHYLSTKGLYLNNNTIVSYTSQGERVINDVLRKYMNLDSKMSENDIIGSTPINNNKIAIFLQILSENILDHV
ncbi:RNase_H domain-containing protein [Moumouvirus goulette]|uniref:RNase_H domain-containing protein n=1 Tax=Moumouvirus goulette TaxID=1247379 RepID=M1PND0_9VIRU|nr:RNase_H domain-containing protein [Moumouvirus goulette]AGF85501.1 RNase_H domain-containing protein [Moumouvirus goulette]